MEFACEFVYVPPPQRPSDMVIRRSGPPPRPLRPPPPPPTGPPKDKPPKSLGSSPNVVPESIPESNKDAKKVTKLISIFLKNESPPKPPEASSISVTQQQTPPKTALLPPHMKPAGRSRSPSHSQPLKSQEPAYALPKDEPDLNAQTGDQNYCYIAPGGIRGHKKLQDNSDNVPASEPEYLVVLPSSPKPPTDPPLTPPSLTGQVGSGHLLGNPNVILVSLGKLLSEEKVQPMEGEPTCCSLCGSVLDTHYANLVIGCYFCQPSDSTSGPSVPGGPSKLHPGGLFLLNPLKEPLAAPSPMLIFCIDISGSMSITSQVSEGDHVFHQSRLQFVQEAVIQCVQRLSKQQPDIQVGLVSFNFQVTMHGYENVKSRVLRDAELVEIRYLLNAADHFPSPPPLSQTKDDLEKQVMELSASGTTALGPAALLAVAMATRQSGSKVIICTDGKANTDLGNLEVEDIDAHTLLSSTIFYQKMGEFAAKCGVTVSVLSIEGTDCRLDELGTLADRTGGKAVIAAPNRLHPEFEQIIENRTIATHCGVRLQLPKSLRVRGEKEAGHKGVREVGNVGPDKEITFQFGANGKDSGVPPPVPGSRVSIQLQIRYKKRNGQTMLRVHTAEREVTNESSAALSSLSVALIQLNSSQASAALAVRGRLLDARGEGELQRKLIERAIEHNSNAEDQKTFQEWVKAMEPIYNNMQNFVRKQAVTSNTQTLTDAAAVLLYSLKHSNRKSMKNKQCP